MGYQNGGRRYFYRAGSCVFLLFLLVISLTTFLHPASRSEERAPEASLQRGVASSRYDNLSFGIPGKADCIVDREGFALGYIEYHEQPAWVIYKLTQAEVQAQVAKRTNRFREDPEIPTGSATNADYRKSGYDRGHLAPAADLSFQMAEVPVLCRISLLRLMRLKKRPGWISFLLFPGRSRIVWKAQLRWMRGRGSLSAMSRNKETGNLERREASDEVLPFADQIGRKSVRYLNQQFFPVFRLGHIFNVLGDGLHHL